MISPLNRSSAALVMLFLAWGGDQAFAQSPPPAAETAQMTPKEMLSAASSGIDRMRGMVGQMQDLLKKAEERGEADGIQCVRDKLSSSRALVDVSLLSRNAVQEALASNNAVRAASEYRKISVSEGMVDQFLVEAMGCLSDRSESTNEVVRDSSGDGTEEEDLGDLASILDGGDDPSQVTPYQ